MCLFMTVVQSSTNCNVSDPARVRRVAVSRDFQRPGLLHHDGTLVVLALDHSIRAFGDTHNDKDARSKREEAVIWDYSWIEFGTTYGF